MKVGLEALDSSNSLKRNGKRSFVQHPSVMPECKLISSLVREGSALEEPGAKLENAM